ncbi:TniQ family protein [Paraburkholderia phymatum]|uniref:Transposition protein, TnsD-like protein n=1 Tax=Paraburkholderia phymatum (strain DSM 17167 / CIP 108236 / LMG 21445 / STM815) TaxID=391038 RepID=B2JTX7_PARP8|nr:TniQ family protein [Paraburkholderia phymatum]ACC76030.1 transposition protein, TnsD-like protein [Paraburkholderia phymatum STM815]
MHKPALLFFAPSLPDETIQSRVVRHHVLSANRKESDTFLDLFGGLPFSLEQIVPPSLLQLADRMDDGSQAALQPLLEHNTLWLLFEPFLADTPQSATVNIGEMMRPLPRRVVGLHGEAQLCPACVEDDMRTFGMGYWHRTHHVPGVSVCWRHGTRLLSSCPRCHRPFQFPKRLLRQPWWDCHCGWAPAGAGDADAAGSPIMLQYARFAHNLLTQPLGRADASCLRAAYQHRLHEMGFGLGARTRTKAFQSHLVEELGDEFLCAVDPAFAAKRMSFWIRFAAGSSTAHDMPVTRHLLLAMYLFGSRDEFALSLQRASQQEASISHTRAIAAGPAGFTESLPSTPRAAHRRRIGDELAKNRETTIQDLWRKAYRVTSWLYEHDRVWLLETLSTSAADIPGIKPATKAVSPDDERLAAHVDATAAALLATSGKPQQVTKERLLAALPVRIADTPGQRERYRNTLTRVTDNRESTWHFRARRLWWAYAVLGARGDVPLPRDAVILSGVGHYAAQAIIEHCGWEPVLPLAARFDAVVKLAELGITPRWDGLPAWKGRAIGGRSYQRRS